MVRIAIHGIGLLGGFGTGVSDFENVLRAKKFDSDAATRRRVSYADGRPFFQADTSSLAVFVPKRALRRIDHLAQMALLGAYLALEDAKQLDSIQSDMGVIVASGYGASGTTFAFLDSIIKDGDTCASPTHFSNSVHNAAAAHIAILLGSTGPNMTVSQFDMSFPAALLIARQWLIEERVASILVGGVDAYCQVLGYCWDRFFDADPEISIDPLDPNRQSAVIGEGASFLYLSREKGDPPRYGFLEDIQSGNLQSNQMKIPEGVVLILGADGQKKTGLQYVRYTPRNQEVVAYASLYGSLPVGMGFDVAAAALSIKTDTVFPLSSARGASPFRVIDKKQKLGFRKICCLQISPSGKFGIATLNRNPQTDRTS